MLKLKCFLQESKTIYLQSLYNKRVPIRMERPIISITFDDVPRTVITNGVPILDSFNVKATFYTAMGLSDQCTNESIESNKSREVYLSYGDILELNRCGHDISCHTYSHYMLDKGTAQGLARDAQRNVRELCELLNCASIDHFSYPFGQVGFNVKRLLANNYKTMRSSRPGINQLTTDLYLLRAISIYNPTFDKKAIKLIIKKVEL